MESTFGLEIYASNKLAYAGRARSLVVPVEDGEKAFSGSSCKCDCSNCSR